MVPRPKDDQRDPPNRFHLTINDRDWLVDRRLATAGRGVLILPDVWRCRMDDREATVPAKSRETYATLRERLTTALGEQRDASRPGADRAEGTAQDT